MKANKTLSSDELCRGISGIHHLDERWMIDPIILINFLSATPHPRSPGSTWNELTPTLTLSMTLPWGQSCSSSTSLRASSRWRQHSPKARSWGGHSTGTVLLTGMLTAPPPSLTITVPDPWLTSRPATISSLRLFSVRAPTMLCLA